MITPPMKKQQLAIRDGNCRFERPEIAWPLVQPPAYRDPKPIKNPPPTIIKKPFSVNKDSHENSSWGNISLVFVMPYEANSVLRSALIITGLGLDKKLLAIMPPNKIPMTKKKFQISFFQSYLKKGIFAGKHAAHACRRLALMPKFLFPKMSKAGTVRPTSGPAIYHGQGCEMYSKILFIIILLCFDNAKLRVKNDFDCNLCHTTKKKPDCSGILKINQSI